MTHEQRAMPPDPELLVYCEVAPILPKNYDRDFPEECVRPALLDLSDHTDLGIIDNFRTEYPTDPRSLVEFHARYESRATLRADTWYRLPVRRLGLQFKEHDLRDPNTPALHRGILTSNALIKASDFRVAPRFYDPPQTLKQTDYKGDALLEIGDEPRLVVIDCGQGNWNEVIGTQGRLLYDMGASSRWTKKQIHQLVARRTLASPSGPQLPTQVIISHWDVDHYHAILETSPAELACIDYLVGPDLVPDTATVKRTLALLSQHGVRHRLLKPTQSPPGRGRKVILQRHSSRGPFTILRSTQGRNRNTAGIVVTFQGHHKTAILTGDHHHDRVLDALASQLGGQTDVLYVIPHHGGRAGKMVSRDWRQATSDMEGLVSYEVGNPYGHPFPSVLRSVERVGYRHRVGHTARHGDLVRSL